MSKLSFRARALDASKPMPIYLAEELPDLPDYSAINRAVPQMPSGMEKEEECEHHLQRAICTGLIIPTPEVFEVNDLEFYERCYPPDYKMPKQHIHMQPLWQEQETPEYDIDSEDEKWLKSQRHPELTELKFEQMMDKLEKSSGQTVVTLNEAKLLLDRNDDLLIAVYDYWLNKRLKTQHPLILSVRTESRPGQSSNNPYLAFRRRTEKMQTRKNRKNDESSYEKMLKLRRDLARALTLLELVERRERVKRDLVRLTALLTEKRYHAGDFANHIADIPPRPQYTSVQIPGASFRREQFTLQHYPPRAPSTPVDQPRIRERRAYKRARKYRHFAPGANTAHAHPLRDSGVCTSSEEESSRTDVASPDDGPFAFKRKPGCYYEMPTSTIYGDPVDPTIHSKYGLYQHELDERTRYTLTSINHPYPKCVGFARRRLARGGRVVLDRIQTPLDDLWTRLDFTFPHSKRFRTEKEEEMELETKLHRSPKVLTRDYHTSGKYPWRHAFRQHLRRNGHLWTDNVNADEVKFDIDDIRLDVGDVKMDISDDKLDISDVKFEINDVKMDTDNKFNSDWLPQEVKSDISVSARTIDGLVKDNLGSVIRKRAWSACSDSSYDSDESLKPVEKQFEHFVNEVNKKWLHFRPKTPPTPVEQKPIDDGTVPLTSDTTLSVELRFAEEPPSGALDPFVTEEFTLGQIYGDVVNQDPDNSGSSLDITGDDLLPENFTGLTDAQVESILSDTDLKALADDKKPLPDDLLDELVKDVDTKSFLLQGQSQDGRTGSGQRKRKEAFGCSVVHTSADKEPVYVETETLSPPLPPVEVKPPAPATRLKVNTPIKVKAEPAASVRKPETPKPVRVKHEHAIESVPTSKIIVEEVNEVSQPQIKIEKKRSGESIEELQLSHGVQLKTVQTKHSPLKKHIITASAHRRVTDVAVVTSQPAYDAPPQTLQPQIVTVAVSESLKAHLQSQIAAREAVAGSGAGGTVVGVVNNGPPALAVLPVPIHSHHATRVTAVGGAGTASTSGGARRVSAPLVQLAAGQAAHKPQAILQHQQPVVVAHSHAIHQQQPNKLKVLHAHPLTQTQRTQLLAQNRGGLAQLPAVVSLAALGDNKGNTALIKGAGVAQFFEIKGGQLAKGPHLVNVVRQPAPGKTTVATRLDLNDVKKRQVVLEGGGRGGGAGGAAGVAGVSAARQRVSVSLDGRHLVRAALPAAAVRQQLHLRNRTLQVGTAGMRGGTGTATSLGGVGHGVVASLVPVGVAGQKLALSGTRQLPASVQAIALSAAQLKPRPRAMPQHPPSQEIVEATPAPTATSSQAADTPLEASNDDSPSPNGAVRRRPADNLPMEVT